MAAKKKSSTKAASSYVIVRAYSGVFAGELVAKYVRDGSSYDGVFRNVRQVWQWTSTGLAKPVLTVGDIAIRGVGAGSKVSDPAPELELADIKAIFVCTPEAESNLRAAK